MDVYSAVIFPVDKTRKTVDILLFQWLGSVYKIVYFFNYFSTFLYDKHTCGDLQEDTSTYSVWKVLLLIDGKNVFRTFPNLCTPDRGEKMRLNPLHVVLNLFSIFLYSVFIATLHISTAPTINTTLLLKYKG